MPAGSIVVDLLMRTGSFETDTKRAEKALQKFEKQAIETGKAIGAGIAAGVGIAAVAFQQLISSAGDFQDLAEKTGAAAEDLASFAVSAAVGGASMDQVAAASQRLTKNLTGVDDESKDAGAAIAALGLNLADFKKLDSAAQMDAVAKALAGFADGAGKTAIAMALFGKTGADLLPFLKELGAEGGRQKILTAEQIALADDYADKQAKQLAVLKLYAAGIAADMLPALTALTSSTVDAIKALSGLGTQVSGLAEGNALQDFAFGTAKALAVVIEAIVGVGKALYALGGSFQSVAADAKVFGVAADIALNPLTAGARGAFGDLKKALDDRAKIAADANQKYIDLWNYDGTRISKAIERASTVARAVPMGSENDPRRGRGFVGAPVLDFSGKVPKDSKGPADDPSKQLLDNALKAIEAAIAREREAMQDRNRWLDENNAAGLLSIASYYAERQRIEEAGVQAQIDLYDTEIKALRERQALPTTKKTEKADIDGKINDILEKQAKLRREAAAAGTESAQKQTAAEFALRDSLLSVNAQILEMQGHFAEAAAIRFDQQNAGLRQLFTANGQTDALGQLDALRNLAIARANFTEVTDASSNAVEGLRIQEDRLAIAQQLGAVGELEGLRQLGEARQGALAQMTAFVEAQEAIARASGDTKLVQQAQRSRVALEQLGAVADPLRDKFKTLFVDGFADAFASFITGAKSASQAFQDFANSIIQALARIAAQQIAQSILGAFISNFASAYTGTQSPGGYGGTGQVDRAFGARASGGAVNAGQMYEVTERGPELLEAGGRQFLMMGKQAGHVRSAVETAGVSRSAAKTVTEGAAPSGPMKIEIINSGTPQRVTGTQQTNQRTLQVMVEDIAVGSLQRGGRGARAVQSTFGANPAAGVTRR